MPRSGKTIDDLYRILPTYRRFDETQNVVLRSRTPEWRDRWSTTDLQKENKRRHIENNDKGYTQEDYALTEGADTITDLIGGRIGTFIVSYAFAFDGPVNPRRVLVEDPAEMSEKVKKAATLFGACLVGIAPLDWRWIYKPRYNPATGRGDLPEFPKAYERVVALAVEMDYEMIRTSPGVRAAAATRLGYSKMSFVAASLARYIRGLGYRAIPSGNETALSIPLAIQAGLGELGRNGLLITPEYGPRVRLCKVFTDLPLEPDRPISFGVGEACEGCNRCVEGCPAQAISGGEPTFEGPSISNNPGVLKWYVHPDRCRHFWNLNGVSCSNCIKSCPYNSANPFREHR
ncbi:MAG: reductive dehalogenase [Candidatus Geothermarchaeales archaeon]